MRKTSEIKKDITEVKLAKTRARLYGEDISDYILQQYDLERELEYAESFEDVMKAVDEELEQSFQYPLGKATTAITETYHDRHAHLFLVQTTLGTIYNVKTEDEYGFLTDHYTGFDKDEAVKTYIEAFDQILDKA